MILNGCENGEYLVKKTDPVLISLVSLRTMIVTNSAEALAECVRETEFDVEFDYEHEIKQAYPYLMCYDTRKWKGVTLQDLESLKDDYQLSAFTQTQVVGERLK